MIRFIRFYRSLDQRKKVIYKTASLLILAFFWAALKMAVSAYEKSLFLFLSALFSFFLIASKSFALVGFIKDKDAASKKYAIASSAFLSLSGVFYAAFNLRLAFGYFPNDYGNILSISIALGSFLMIVLSIVGLAKKKGKNVYLRILNWISFASALTDLMLTQMALLMFTSPEMDQIYNLYFALGIGLFAFFLGAAFFAISLKRRNTPIKQERKN